MGFIV